MDYRFIIELYQEQAGDDNANVKIEMGETVHHASVEVTATDPDSPQYITWEATGLTDPGSSVTHDVKVTMLNEYYVDASTDRNVVIKSIRYTTKDDGSTYKYLSDSTKDDDGITSTWTDIPDTSDPQYYLPNIVHKINTTADEADSSTFDTCGITEIAGNDVDASAYTALDYVKVWTSEPVTCTVATPVKTTPAQYSGAYSTN